MARQCRFPPGWDVARVRRVLRHYEGETYYVAPGTKRRSTRQNAVRALIAKRDRRLPHRGGTAP